MSREEKDKEKKPIDIPDILNMRILGLDLGNLVKTWLGISDLNTLLDPSKVEEVRRRLEEQRSKLLEAQEQIRRKYGDAIRVDYDIRIGLLGEREGIRIGGGRFFDQLDRLAREGKAPRAPVVRVTAPQVTREPRKPVTEVIEGDQELQVVAEVPGVEEEQIKLDIGEDKVVISTESPERRYRGEVPLPAKVNPQPREKTYRNGILKLVLTKK